MNHKGSIIVKIAAIIVTGIVVIVLGIYGMNQFMKLPGKAIEGGIDIAKAFKTGTIETIWRDEITEVSGSNYLQVAKLNSTEAFNRKDTRNIMWDMIGLPDVEVQIQAPVEFTFYLDLKEEWDFKWRESDYGITVLAPEIRCNTPAIDVSRMNINITKSSILRFDEKKIREKFKKEVTTALIDRSDRKIPLIREIARNETKNFVSHWFVDIVFKDVETKPYVKDIYFADEQIPDNVLEELSKSDIEEKL